MTFNFNGPRTSIAELSNLVNNNGSINSTDANLTMLETPVGTTSFREVQSATNVPAEGAWFIQSVRNYNVNALYGMQIAWGRDGANAGEIYTRVVENAVWGSWKRVANDANIGDIGGGGGGATMGTYEPVFNGIDTITYTSMDGRYTLIGDTMFFVINIAWTGAVSTANEFSVLLPSTPVSGSGINATINQRLSSGIDLSGLPDYWVDLSTAGGLGITSFVQRQSYNDLFLTGAGDFSATGHYQIAVG